jgi:hypothetical protein
MLVLFTRSSEGVHNNLPIPKPPVAIYFYRRFGCHRSFGRRDDAQGAVRRPQRHKTFVPATPSATRFLSTD